MIKIRALLLVCGLILASFAVAAAQDAPDCPGAPPSRLFGAAHARVSPGLANNMRAEPRTTAEKVGELPAHVVFEIQGEPVCAGGYVWWPVQYPSAEYAIAWTAEGNAEGYWLEPYTHPEPEILLTPDDTEGQETFEVAYRGVSFIVDRDLAAGVKVEHVFPNFIFDHMSAPSTGNPTPDGLRFTFVDAEGESVGILLQVYALADFARLPDGLPSAVFGKLESMLEPDAELKAEPVYSMLLLPDRIAPVLFQDVFRPIDFQNGRGVSYFAHYSYAADPIISLIYTYTGLTSDGLYYVTLQRTVTTDLLPDLDTDDYKQADWEKFYETFDAYRAQIADNLRTASPDDFTPSLAPLDALIATISIEAPQP
jgi:hypothetical protein